MKRALAKQKRPLIMGLLMAIIVAAITFAADYMDALRQQNEFAKIQTQALVTRLTAVNREVRAASDFLAESDSALSRFGAFIDQLSGSAQQPANWAVIATTEPGKAAPFKTWAEAQFRSLGTRVPQFSSTSEIANLVMLTTGSESALIPGTSVSLPADATFSNGPTPLSTEELTLAGPPDSIWLVLKLDPGKIQMTSGVQALLTLRRVDLNLLRAFAQLSEAQRLKISWLPKDGSRPSIQIGAPDMDGNSQPTASMQIGAYNVMFALDNPPMQKLPRTWLLLLLAGAASTAFWVAWGAASTLNVRAGALEEKVDATSGQLRVIHEKESAFFENAGTPQCEVEPATGSFLRVNQAFCKWLGYEAEELLQKTAYEISVQEDVAVSHLHAEKAKSSPDKMLQLEKRYLTKAGRKVWGLVTSNLFTNPITGKAVFLTTIVDITVRKEADAMRDRLLRELAHRVRNTMQLTDSLARQSAVGTRSAQSYAADFRSRLAALSRAQDILFETNWVSADMNELATRIVKPFDNGKIKLDLPKVELPPQHTQTFALAVHELISRSAERGAVKNGKTVEFTGEFDGLDELGKRKLILRWQEPMTTRGRRTDVKSFGDSMLRLALPRQFDGEANFLGSAKGWTYEARLTLPDE